MEPNQMQSPPISQAEIESRIRPHLDELLKLWWAGQGTEKIRDLAVIAASLPFPTDESLRVLDLCSGPGDVGRAVRSRFPGAQIDFVDRDPFLCAICTGVNLREGIGAKTIVRDLQSSDWHDGLSQGFDAVVTANALHWLDVGRAKQVFRDVWRLLRSGGVFVFAEPAYPAEPFKAGLEQWKSKQPPRYSRENWERFWSRANDILGYDHIELLGQRHANRIGDTGIAVEGWMDLLKQADFSSSDVLLRDADEVIAAAVKP